MAKTPVQERSRRTLDRLLDGAESVLSEKSWPEISIQDIVKRARSSVGSFYARFDSKEQLLVRLSGRLSDDVAATFEQLNALSTTLSATQFIERAISELINFHHRRRGLIRALTLVPRLDSSSALRSDGLRNADVFGSLAARISEISNSPERARLGLFVVSLAIREAVIFPDISKSLLSFDHNTLARELSTILISYLES